MNPGLTLDAGALIGIEHGSRRMQALLERVAIHRLTIAVPAGVIGQVWRGGARQARLARFLVLEHVTIVPLDGMRARAAGIVCARTGTSDVIDASVVLCARELGHRTIVTSDPDDLTTLDPGLDLVSL
jgi:predicted nucleic acid-binding protein